MTAKMKPGVQRAVIAQRARETRMAAVIAKSYDEARHKLANRAAPLPLPPLDQNEECTVGVSGSPPEEQFDD